MKTLSCFLLAAILLGGVALAEDDDLSEGRERILNGHSFLPSLYVRDPWVATTFHNETGGGMALDLETPFYNLDGEEVFVLEGDLFYASLGLGFQQKLGRKFAVGLFLAGKVRTGTNAQTLIASGANVDRNMNAWVKYRLMRREVDQFTIGVDWDYAKTFIITPQEFARAIIDGTPLEEAPILHSIKGWTARFTMEYARAFSPTLGVRANGQIGLYEEPFTSGISKPTHRLGVLGEADFRPNYGVPVGLTLGYTAGFPDDNPTAGLSGTLLGVWYTGKEAFVVGAETGYMTLPVSDSDEKVNALFGVFTIRYYF